MRTVSLAAVAWALVFASAAGSASPVGSLTAAASPAAAGANPAALTLKLHYEMICGQPGRGPLVVTLPAALKVPATISASALLLRGAPAPSVSVQGHVVTIGLPKRPQVTCLVIGPGTLTITFTTAAGLGNPTAAGAYVVHARIANHTFATQLAIR